MLGQFISGLKHWLHTCGGYWGYGGCRGRAILVCSWHSIGRGWASTSIANTGFHSAKSPRSWCITMRGRCRWLWPKYLIKIKIRFSDYLWQVFSKLITHFEGINCHVWNSALNLLNISWRLILFFTNKKGNALTRLVTLSAKSFLLPRICGKIRVIIQRWFNSIETNFKILKFNIFTGLDTIYLCMISTKNSLEKITNQLFETIF